MVKKILDGSLFRRLHFLNRRIHMPGHMGILRAAKLFSVTERIVFFILACLMIISAGVLTLRANGAFLVGVPSHGGTLREGIIGTPRFINPVLAISDTDKDITALVFSGLLRPKIGGGYENNLASSYELSEDGKTYTVRLDPGARFHDNTFVTADDVVFTVEKIKDPMLKSPRRGDWEGVSVERSDERTVLFHLKKPYAPFLENLTLGILPKSIWSKVSIDEFPWSEFNLQAIGSGPYKVEKITRNSGGIPSEITLRSFEEYVRGEPYISRIKTIFYPNENKAVSALIGGDVESLGGVSFGTAEILARRGFHIETAILPRVFALFFNQNHQKVLADKNVRQALAMAVPREKIVSESLLGYAIPVDGPLPEMAENISYENRLTDAAALLDKAGYVLTGSSTVRAKTTGTGKNKVSTPLSFTIATADTPDLTAAAEKLAEGYRALGVDVSVRVYESGDLQQNIIRSREYDALLFGEVVGRERDLFPFWHSSERFDPGLNIALYANSAADKLLDKLRSESDTLEQQEILASLRKEFTADAPAAFIFAPKYVYVVPERLKRVALESVNHGSERFAGVREWYIDTNTVWKLFAN